MWSSKSNISVSGRYNDRRLVKFIRTMMQTPTTENKESEVRNTKSKQDPTVPTPFDVLCGTGIERANQPGNELFAQCVLKYVEQYANAESKKLKMQISKAAMDELMRSGVRFLKKHPVHQHWYVADEKVGRDRIGHFLRHHSPKPKQLGASTDKGVTGLQSLLPTSPILKSHSTALFDSERIVPQHQLPIIIDNATTAVNYWASQRTQSPAILSSISAYQQNHRSDHNTYPHPPPKNPLCDSDSKKWLLSTKSHRLDSSRQDTKLMSRGDLRTNRPLVDDSQSTCTLDHSNQLFDDEDLADRLDWEGD
jgi:hypothetical protein